MTRTGDGYQHKSAAVHRTSQSLKARSTHLNPAYDRITEDYSYAREGLTETGVASFYVYTGYMRGDLFATCGDD